MTTKQLEKAMALAKLRAGIDFGETQIEVFDGFALPDFDALTCTMIQLADLIRWQAGSSSPMDGVAIAEIAHAGIKRRRFTVLDDTLTCPHCYKEIQ